VGKVLLRTLNFIHDHLWPYNYGIAIMLLTIIIRTLFWPVTHKSTESMKKMASVQPQVEAIRTKYKADPKRMQQEIMLLYRENKINPVGGCLPMLIQIPVFIALFVVLRSAIELRFTSFLWIRDLSEPENLFPGLLPVPINILPVFMAATMWLQQKMTPTAGDPAQAKMMRVMMPVMMLFLLYNYAAGLALYWTTQNALMIFQQLITKRRQKAKAG
jgi:YidC/Oxa1 family membrane protein insertase